MGQRELLLKTAIQLATADLMSAEFGMGGYKPEDLKDLSGLLGGLRVSAGFGSQAFSSNSTGHLRSRESDDGRLGTGFRVDHARPPSRSGRTRDSCEAQHARGLRTAARNGPRHDRRGPSP